MLEIWTVLDESARTIAIFRTKEAAEEYATTDSGQVMRDWLFDSVAEASVRDKAWKGGNLEWYLEPGLR